MAMAGQPQWQQQWMSTAAVLLRRQPMQALYLALAFFALITVIAHQRQPITPDDIADTPPPLGYLEGDSGDPLAVAPAPAPAPVLAVPSDMPGNLSGSVAPEEPQAAHWLEYRVRRGDTMDSVLRAINSDDAMRAYLVAQKMKTYTRLRRGSVVYFQQRKDGQLQRLLYKTSPDYYFTAGRDADGALWAKEEAPRTTSTRHARGGTIDSSLYAATAAAGISEAAADRLVQVLETQIDFYRDVRRGDTFRVLYDSQRDEHGDEIAAGNVLAFEYDNKLESRPRRIRGVYYNDGYYTPAGESLQRAFLPAPLKYRRISSRFSHRRLHPVLKRYRPHRGVDYAAPSGTPVHSTADGTVSLVDKQRGYGRVVMIKHFGIYTTVYAHLRAFKKGIRRGRTVKQGEVIGYVGQSGLATGPHLHYEFRVRGKHKDPLSAVLPKQLPALTGEKLEAFKRHAAPLFAELDAIAPQQG